MALQTDSIEVTDLEVTVPAPNEFGIAPTISVGVDADVYLTVAVYVDGQKALEYGSDLVGPTTYKPGRPINVSSALDLPEGVQKDIEVCVELTDAEVQEH